MWGTLSGDSQKTFSAQLWHHQETADFFIDLIEAYYLPLSFRNLKKTSNN